MLVYFYIALGSALGGVARYFCNNLFTTFYKSDFPYGILLVNVIGSFVIGICFALSLGSKNFIPDNLQKFIMVGLCGGFTTFSSFSLDTINFLQKSEYLKAAINISLSITLCLISTFLGIITIISAIQTK
jgi:CrcB protein